MGRHGARTQLILPPIPRQSAYQQPPVDWRERARIEYAAALVRVFGKQLQEGNFDATLADKIESILWPAQKQESVQ